MTNVLLWFNKCEICNLEQHTLFETYSWTLKTDEDKVKVII